MRRKRTLLWPRGVVAVVALAIAGCGGGNDNVKASAPAASAKASTPERRQRHVGVRTGSLGTYLVDSQGRTLYLFEKDKGTMSICSGACANDWPPSTTSGRPKAGSGVDRALLGNHHPLGRQSQLTYDGHPLYRYSGDGAGRHERSGPHGVRRRLGRRLPGRPQDRGPRDHLVHERRRQWLLALSGGRPARGGRAAGAVGWSTPSTRSARRCSPSKRRCNVQQYASIFYAVNWIGPLFLANAAACLLAAAGLATSRTRPLAALAGIAISACALSGLVLSYGPGLLGWMEAGWRTPIAVALARKLVAVLALGAGLAGAASRPPAVAPSHSGSPTRVVRGAGAGPGQGRGQ